VPSHHAASYYPNYMPQQPMPVSHPPPSSHPPPPVSFSVHQQPAHMRMPPTTGIATNLNPSFFSPAVANPPPPPSSSNVPSFPFAVSAPVPTSQTTMTNTLPPTTTTPTKSVFPNVPKFSVADITSKPPSSHSTTTNITNEKPSNSSKIFIFKVYVFILRRISKNVVLFFYQYYILDYKNLFSCLGPFVFGTANTNLASIFGTGNSISSLPTFPKATKTETNADDEGEGGDEDDTYEPDTSFKPIVTLKPVEVKSGEEDENVLFCERGKLYRFDSATNQMKERGTGEMKILQHKTKNVCRILMRREQVLKLCANHQITSQMELKPHQGTANAYLWSAMDFADGEPKHETLCIKFKTDEQAKNFAKIFNESKQTNSKKSGDLPSIGKMTLHEETKPKPNTNDDGMINS
jgi:hypothetical protein